MKNTPRILIAVLIALAATTTQLHAVKPSKADAERREADRQRAAEEAAKRPVAIDPFVVVAKPSNKPFEHPVMKSSEFRSYIISKEGTKQKYSEEGEEFYLEIDKGRTVVDPAKGIVAVYSLAADYMNCLPVERNAQKRTVSGVTVKVKDKVSRKSSSGKNPGNAVDVPHYIFYKNGQMPKDLKDTPFTDSFTNPMHLEFRSRNTPQDPVFALYKSPKDGIEDVLPSHLAVRAAERRMAPPSTARCLAIAAALTPGQIESGVEDLRLVLAIRIRDHAATHLESFQPQSPDSTADNCWTYVICQLESIHLLDSANNEISILPVRP